MHGEHCFISTFVLTLFITLSIFQGDSCDPTFSYQGFATNGPKNFELFPGESMKAQGQQQGDIAGRHCTLNEMRT